MTMKGLLIDELRRNGYSKEGSKKVWNLAERDLLYATKDLAQGFLKLRGHPRYKEIVIDTEIELIRKNSGKILEDIGDGPFNLIDMGCGDGTKAKAFIEALGKKKKIRYCPVNINKELANLALKNVKGMDFENVQDYRSVVARHSALGEVLSVVRDGDYGKCVVLIFGSILASYEINEYLFGLSQVMFPDDVLIIGNGIRKGERLANLDNYRHKILSGWFMGLLKELGFRDNDVEYDARFVDGRVEMFYEIKVDKILEEGDKKFEIKKGDEVLIARLYKYFDKELEGFCKKYFCKTYLFKDKEEEYALVLSVK